MTRRGRNRPSHDQAVDPVADKQQVSLEMNRWLDNLDAAIEQLRRAIQDEENGDADGVQR